MAMTTWDLYCLLHCQDLTVLGPKCHSDDCLQPAVATVHWPTGPLRCCAGCTARWRDIAERGFGMHVAVVSLPTWVPAGLDDAEQRFRMMELE